MPRITFTPNIQRHVACPTVEVAATTLRQALDAVFADNPRARGYVLDEQGSIRKHMLIFVNGATIQDPVTLTDTLPPDAEVYIAQALSGG